jgi:ketosteroid isomerase-like protein
MTGRRSGAFGGAFVLFARGSVVSLVGRGGQRVRRAEAIVMDSMKQTVLNIIDRINAHDVDGIMDLVSLDYEFVNSSGDHFRDRQFICDTWRAQFQNHPDYRIRVEHVICDEQCVGVFGWAEGTYAPDGEMRDDDHWEVPCAFLFKVKTGKVTYFESYADSSIVFDVMKSRSRGADMSDVTSE